MDCGDTVADLGEDEGWMGCIPCASHGAGLNVRGAIDLREAETWMACVPCICAPHGAGVEGIEWERGSMVEAFLALAWPTVQGQKERGTGAEPWFTHGLH